MRLVRQILIGLTITPAHHITIHEAETRLISGQIGELGAAVWQVVDAGHRRTVGGFENQGTCNGWFRDIGVTGGQTHRLHRIAHLQIGVDAKTPGRGLGKPRIGAGVDGGKINRAAATAKERIEIVAVCGKPNHLSIVERDAWAYGLPAGIGDTAIAGYAVGLAGDVINAWQSQGGRSGLSRGELAVNSDGGEGVVLICRAHQGESAIHVDAGFGAGRATGLAGSRHRDVAACADGRRAVEVHRAPGGAIGDPDGQAALAAGGIGYTVYRIEPRRIIWINFCAWRCVASNLG